MFYAHSTSRRDRSDWQRLSEHLSEVGASAAERANKFGAARAALLAGLGHDLGKYSSAFQRRLTGGPPVDHATAGARAIVQAAADGDPPRSKLSRRLSETVAYAVAGHHAGLPDRCCGPGSLEQRLYHTAIPGLDPTWVDEIGLDAPGHVRREAHPDGRDAFQLAFLGRMIFSALIDADRRDTERHAVETGQELRPDREWPRLSDRVDAMITALDAHVAGLARPGSDPALNAIRARILRAARDRGQDERGIYTLTVPTGGGKTLSVMRFALGHAAHHRRTHAEPRGIERIVVAIPFTTVTEQTAEVLREILGADAILEHHSAIEAGSAKDEERLRLAGENLDRKRRLAMEDWAAPVVVTTNVQLFESLFSHRPSRCRKLHNLANSVIVLDEAQTIPRRLLRPCLAALDELARNYGSTVVLCTATQPAIGCPEAREKRGLRGGLALGPEREIAPDPAGLHEEMRRATIHMPTKPTTGGKLLAAPMADDDLADALASTEHGFVIVNSRRHALALYRTAERAKLAGLVHLTTRQYPAHRRAVIAAIKAALRLDAAQPCRLVATSLIEAGIDLDFAAGWRALAGLESLVQSAGRVNREGRRPREASVLTVFTPADDANKPSPDIAGLIGDLGRIAGRHPDLAHPDAVRAYFEEVYWRCDDELDVIEVAGEDGQRVRRRVLDCFRVDPLEPTTDFAYRTVGENFRMVEERMRPVIVARDEKTREVLARLNRPNVSAGAVSRDLQPFIVQVPERDRAKLIARGDVQYRREDLFGDQFPVLEAGTLYDPNVGLLWEEDAQLGSEDTIF